MDPETQTLLDESIASLRIGNKDEARRKLMQIINEDERNEIAWFYLSEAVDNDEDRQICLENVVAINPTNERAVAQLNALLEKMAREKPKEGSVICQVCGATNPLGSQRCLSCYAALDEAIPASPEMSMESAPREVRHKSFMEMLDTWGEMFTLPKQARLDEEHAYARWGLVVPGILAASGIAYFFVSLTNIGTTLLVPGSRPDVAQLLPCACGGAVGGAVGGLISFLIYSGLYFLVARLFQGKGEFLVQTYLLSLVYGPFSLVFGIISPLTLLSAIDPMFGLIPALVYIPVSILALIMSVRALKSVHGYGTGGALGTIFLPGIVFGCIGALLATLLVGGSLLTNLPFNVP